jgi:hypothetical protein
MQHNGYRPRAVSGCERERETMTKCETESAARKELESAQNGYDGVDFAPRSIIYKCITGYKRCLSQGF